MFDVTVDRAVRRSTERIAEILYTVLLRELGYAEDYGIAELEIELEERGLLEQFEARCLALHGEDWTRVRKGATKLARARAVLHAMDPASFPNADTWATSLGQRAADITMRRLVERTFELTAVRGTGRDAARLGAAPAAGRGEGVFRSVLYVGRRWGTPTDLRAHGPSLQLAG